MTAADRICSFLESKLPRSFWDFHGPSIREFVLRELVADATKQNLPPPVDFAEQSRVEPAEMREVIEDEATAGESKHIYHPSRLIAGDGRTVVAEFPLGECLVRWCRERHEWVSLFNLPVDTTFIWRELTKDEEQVVT